MSLDAAGEARIENLLAACTLKEKVAMAAGSGLWYSTPVERLGIPAFKMSDGPNGVRGDGRDPTAGSTCFPVGTALAASWDLELIGEVGATLAREARARSTRPICAPSNGRSARPVPGAS